MERLLPIGRESGETVIAPISNVTENNLILGGLPRLLRELARKVSLAMTNLDACPTDEVMLPERNSGII